MKTRIIVGQASRLSHTSNPTLERKTILKKMKTGATPVLLWLALLLSILNSQFSTAFAQGSLTPPGAWTTLGNAAANRSGMFQFADTNAPLFPMRFDRAVSP